MKNDQIKDRSMLNEIVQPLTDWYRQNKRILPWRDQNNAYYTWVSEIMLQQTRVEAVKPYFQRFIGELPDVQALAECPEEKLMKLWEGLGYYNRVRNMQIAAQTVMEQYNGELPADYEKLRELKGIGNYTAGAIASIAYGIPVPAVDGNVLRILMRVSADDSDIMKQSVKTKVEQALLKVIPKRQPTQVPVPMSILTRSRCGKTIKQRQKTSQLQSANASLPVPRNWLLNWATAAKNITLSAKLTKPSPNNTICMTVNRMRTTIS